MWCACGGRADCVAVQGATLRTLLDSKERKKANEALLLPTMSELARSREGRDALQVCLFYIDVHRY